MSNCYLHIKDLIVSFKDFEGKKEVLNIEELIINKGEAYGVIGESGSGKTVLALTLLRLLQIPPGKIEQGEIIFDGENLLNKTEMEMNKIFRGKKISMIFQDPMSTLNPVLTVGEQMINVIKHNQGLNKEEANYKAKEMLELVRLPDAKRNLNKYPHELSGGQRQRVIIALALSCGAEFIIADEPTRNLDVTIQAGILKLLKELEHNLNVTVLFISNNPGVVYSICDKVAVIFQGTIVEKGSVEEVFKNPLHPYTYALLHSIPRDKKEKINLEGLSHEISEDTLTGCNYYNRCMMREEICKGMLRLEHINGTHFIRCHKSKVGENYD